MPCQGIHQLGHLLLGLGPKPLLLVLDAPMGVLYIPGCLGVCRLQHSGAFLLVGRFSFCNQLFGLSASLLPALAQGGGVVPALCGEKTIKIINGIALLTWE